ncbi:ABC transporter ATP-binding protein [Dermacoccus nishinomiyaensis]|uniref:ABC transporter ATP-binding protein n=1 Tax=Dermacoccus nishinomiyaensis TaxID=1274 RepID=UPI0021A752BA|nr:ABC transporter ATP-binding protein [Dermacoccus nishinomiyaensis]MCT1603375.1 ABC transporter ATP-binding protein/permease [Dermacoccus nishinomiyaensis]
MLTDLRYLVGTFPRRDRIFLGLNAVVQFVLALMDLIGIAAILPLVQVVMGAPLDEGTLGAVHRFLGAPGERDFVLLLSGIMVTAFVFKALLGMVLMWWSASNILRMQTRTARNLLDSFMAESYLRHRQRNTGELMRAVGSAVTDAHSKVLGGFANLFSSVMSILLIIALLCAVAPIQTLVAVCYFGFVVFVIQRSLGPANRRAGEEAQHTSWVSSHALVDAMQGFREAVLHNAQDYFVNRFDDANKRTARASMRANFYAGMPKYLLEVVTMVGLTVFISLTILTGSAQSTMPTLSVFVAGAVKILPLMVAVTTTIGLIRVGREGLRITVETLRETEITRPATVGQANAPDGNVYSTSAAIEVSDVSFRYPDSGSNVLTDINLSIPPGSSLALCGLSGSGKTTLVDIILGLLPPSIGSVTYADIPTTRAGNGWYDVVAYVPQDVYISDGTLAENVAFGVAPEEHDRALIHSCLSRAALEDVVSALPEGIDTLVGERGNRLSGGQRQRLGIARALYRQPQVLVLDEATSALDNDTEARITQALTRIHGEITTIIVAHRLSTVRHVDALAFLKDGRVQCVGEFDDVRRRSPDFAHLVELGRLDPTDEGDPR